ncbi:Cof-type HAD-IIB family hydrolase [Facklamia sp. 7083-14-GEN3]|uniref:Cof-type HAD-IIB family hydrolase n=1 Tax=Facklamia sp. 7083-14-GEN3 TaxID=2973478 RepID=UPI00215CEA0C|nr:Cof-type HAD-IIB family hydrolase [Facklamia sp. 7083-14-GEN3]MCR8968995.1 Cof-type HAD-IIB family hydrolase [Facklamia sp. 7083-14-GEN3]
MIQLIAIDLDGTLLKSTKEVTAKNLEALHYAQEKGVKVVICTGRPYSTMHHLIDQIGLKSEDDYLILYNGAFVQRISDGQVLIQEELTSQDLYKWYKELTSLNLPLNVLDQEWVYEPLTYPKGYESFYAGNVSTAPHTKVDFSDFDEDHRFMKFVVTIDEDHLSQQIPLLNKELVSQYTLSRSHPFQLEIMKAGVNKGNALKKLSDQLNIQPSAIMAIGDQMNDESMIEFAGLGIVMENGADALKEMADYITLSNDQDGVAHAIYQFIK